MPSEQPEITHLFIKCLEYRYARAFIERGAMHFAMPSEWEPDGTSRGDNLEGVYASQMGFDPTLDLLLKSLRKESFTINSGEMLFYKSKEVTSFRAYCLYGLNNNCMYLQEKRSQDHQFHKAGLVKKEYFRNLFPNVTPEMVDKIEEGIRPAALFIKPDAFVELLTRKLMEWGVKKEEIYIGPIRYYDFFLEALPVDREPVELFCKHNAYEEQSEIRIVIDTRREEVRKLFENDGNIELGPIDEKIASLHDSYFKDVWFEIFDNQLRYELPRPEVYEINDEGQAYISLLYQALCDELPESPMSIDKIESQIEKCMSVIRGVDPSASYNRKTNILFYKGEMVDLGGSAGYKMLEHYNNYIIEGDIDGAGETIAKFKHFFPKYDMGDYFSAYYKALEGAARERI